MGAGPPAYYGSRPAIAAALPCAVHTVAIFLGEFARTTRIMLLEHSPFEESSYAVSEGGDCSFQEQARVQLQNFKFQFFFPALVWRFKSRRNKKRIATVVCKWRDESNEPN